MSKCTFPLKLLLSGAATLIGTAAVTAQPWQLASPDGKLLLQADFVAGSDTQLTQSGSLQFRILRGPVEVVDWSPVGIEFIDTSGGMMNFFENLKVVNAVHNANLQERFTQPRGKQRVVDIRYNEMSLHVENAVGDELKLVFRAFNDGIAFRYDMAGSGRVTLVREHTGFRPPEGSLAWLQAKDYPSMYAPNYQDPIERMPAGNPSTGNGFVLPALFNLPDASTWFLFHESGLTIDYHGAHLAAPTADRLYRVAQPHPSEGNGVGAVSPSAVLPFSTPWRLFVVGDLAAVVQTHLVEALADPYDAQRFGHVDWIQPGKSAWSWWSQTTGDPTLQRKYIDFAATHGWQYVLIDANWDRWPNASSELQALAAYAAERGVRLNLWYNSGGPHNNITESPRNRMHIAASRRAELDKIASWGFSGIKVDFFFSDKQDRIQQYIGIMEDAMERRLLVNFHGATVPRGWSRTYPNLLTTEAVIGAEMYKWPPGPAPLQHVRYTFTRNVVGPMDYTPLTFYQAWVQEKITYAHQLALAVVFESGLQHFADRADGHPSAGYGRVFANRPEVAPFLAGLPTAWDASRLLQGHPDSHSVWARRRGEVWFVGGINGLTTDRSVSIQLADFADTPVTVQIFKRGTTGADLDWSESTYVPTDSITLTMGSYDGFVLRISPVPNAFDEWIAARVADLSLRTPEADADSDGVANLVEYAFDMDPTDPTDHRSENLPRLMDASDHAGTLRFKRRTAAALSELVLQSASNPAFIDASALPPDSITEAPDGWSSLPLPASANPRYYRVLLKD